MGGFVQFWPAKCRKWPRAEGLGWGVRSGRPWPFWQKRHLGLHYAVHIGCRSQMIEDSDIIPVCDIVRYDRCW